MKRLAIFFIAILCAVNSCHAVLKASCDYDYSPLGACAFRFALESAQNPDVQQARMLLDFGRELEITEPQARSGCKAVQAFTNCTADYVEQCVDKTAVPDLHQIVRGTTKLMEACDKPGMHAQGMTLVKCAKTLASVHSVRECFDTAGYWAQTSQADGLGRHPNQTLELLRTGHVLNDLCCIFKDLRTCIESDVNSNCSIEAVELLNSKADAVWEAYRCRAKMADSCPVRGPRPRPLPEPCLPDPYDRVICGATYLHASTALSVFILAGLLLIKF